jgi:hypothetical protein
MYCDVLAVGLTGQQRKNALPLQRKRTQQWAGRVFSAVCSEEMFSLLSVPRLYNSDLAAVELVRGSQ